MTVLNFLTRSLKGPSSKRKEADLGGENSLYYNEELKQWVERGKEDEAKANASSAPPPTAYVHGGSVSRKAVNQRYVLQSNLKVSPATSSDSLNTFLVPPATSATPPKFFIPSPNPSANSIAGQEIPSSDPAGCLCTPGSDTGNESAHTNGKLENAATLVDSMSDPALQESNQQSERERTKSTKLQYKGLVGSLGNLLSHKPGVSSLDVDLSNWMHPKNPVKLSGPLPWELPEEIKQSDDWYKYCQNYHRDPSVRSILPLSEDGLDTSKTTVAESNGNSLLVTTKEALRNIAGKASALFAAPTNGVCPNFDLYEHRDTAADHSSGCDPHEASAPSNPEVKSAPLGTGCALQNGGAAGFGQYLKEHPVDAQLAPEYRHYASNGVPGHEDAPVALGEGGYYSQAGNDCKTLQESYSIEYASPPLGASDNNCSGSEQGVQPTELDCSVAHHENLRLNTFAGGEPHTTPGYPQFSESQEPGPPTSGIDIVDQRWDTAAARMQCTDGHDEHFHDWGVQAYFDSPPEQQQQTEALQTVDTAFTCAEHFSVSTEGVEPPRNSLVGVPETIFDGNTMNSYSGADNGVSALQLAGPQTSQELPIAEVIGHCQALVQLLQVCQQASVVSSGEHSPLAQSIVSEVARANEVMQVFLYSTGCQVSGAVSAATESINCGFVNSPDMAESHASHKVNGFSSGEDQDLRSELQRMQDEYMELLVCLGQESKKASALAEALTQMNIDPEPIIAQAESEFMDEQDF